MLAALLCVLSGYYVAGGRESSLILYPLLFTSLVTGAGNIINDYFDIDIDRVNKPRRPLPSGRLTTRWALVSYAVLTVGVTIASFIILPVIVASIFVAWEALLFAYAVKAKRVLIIGNVLVAATTSSAFWLGALIAGTPAASVLPFCIAFLFILSREIVKGAEDIDGDARASVATIAVVHGVDAARLTAIVVMLLLVILITAPGVLETYGKGYFWTMEGLVIPALIVSIFMMIRNPVSVTFNRVSWILKAGMFFGIFAIAIAKL